MEDDDGVSKSTADRVLVILNVMILGINLAVEPYSFAMLHNHRALFSICVDDRNNVTEHFMDELKANCDRVNVSLSDIEAIGILRGPGSYTGVRIGVTIANTLAQLIGCPVYGISTHDALAFPYRYSEGSYMTAVRGRKGELNICLSSSDGKLIQNVSDNVTLSIASCIETLFKFKAPILVLGDVSGMRNEFKTEGVIKLMEKSPDPISIAEMAAEYKDQNREGSYKKLTPYYSHGPTMGNSKKV